MRLASKPRHAGTVIALAALLGSVWLAGRAATLVSAVTERPQSKGKAKSAPVAVTVLAEDKGHYRILLDGQTVGSEVFQISPAGSDAKGGQEWMARGATEIRVPNGAPMQVSGKLRLAADGAPLHYEWSAQSSKKASATIDFQGGTAKMSLQLQGAKPFIQELSFGTPRVVILDNNLYHHYAILSRLYDWNKKGAQTFPVLVPQDMTPGSIIVESLGPQTVEGTPLELLRVRTADLEVNLYLDASRRVVRLAVPSSKAEIRRE